MQSGIYGIIGTLLGTILGWILSEFSKIGRLNIFSSWKDEFEKNEKGSMVQSNSKDSSESYTYHASIDIYNSSAFPMIMREIEIVFFKDKKELFRDVPQDDLTKKISGSFSSYDDISAITIPAKSVYSVRLHGGFWNNDDRFKKIWNTNRVILTYRDKRNKLRKQIIINKDYNEYFNA